MSSEFCLLHRDKGSSDDFKPADYTVGWTKDECLRNIIRYRNIADLSDWETGVREVGPWRICAPGDGAAEQELPGLEISDGSKVGTGAV